MLHYIITSFFTICLYINFVLIRTRQKLALHFMLDLVLVYETTKNNILRLCVAGQTLKFLVCVLLGPSPARCPHYCTYETDRGSLCQPPCLELCQTRPCPAPLLC